MQLPGFSALEGEAGEHARQRGNSERQRLQRLWDQIPRTAHGQSDIPGEQIALKTKGAPACSRTHSAWQCTRSQRAILCDSAHLLCGVR